MLEESNWWPVYIYLATVNLDSIIKENTVKAKIMYFILMTKE